MSPPGPGGPGADAALIRTVEALQGFLARPGYVFSNAELLASIRTAHSLIAVANAAYLGLVAELDVRPEVLPGVAAGRAAATFLREGLRVSGPQAGRDVRAAKAIASATPELPAMGTALAEGTVSRDHLDVAVSTVQRIPKALKTKTVEPVVPTDVGDQPGDQPGDDEGTVGTVTGVQAIDALLAEQSRVLPPSTVDLLGRQIIARLDPDRAERFDADAYQRRTYAWSRDFAGMGVYKFVVDPATDAILQAAIAAWSAPRPAGSAVDEHGQVVRVVDERTPGQRRADAVADLIQAGAATRPTRTTDPADPGDPTDDGEDLAGQSADDPGDDLGDAPTDDLDGGVAEDRPLPAWLGRGLPDGVYAAKPFPGVQVTAVATLDQLAAAFGATDPAAQAAGLARLSLSGPIGSFSGSTLAPETLARLACDTPIRRILVTATGAILDHGRARRFATDAQRRVLAVRDNGCVIPGCACPPEWCEAHHLIPWEDGGKTDLDNLALLCARHHTAHHAGVYRLEMRDGIPWVRLPGWQDLRRPWLRNTTHHDHHHVADRLARRLTEQPPLPWEHPGDAA